ncbi:unannotated protein [freshwater metagenome]|uniref:Unannotated protein n=1 Tax=freshwater metagenome TaxID=449393 RepID=A0A6J6CUY1_9ZZZZ
MAAKNTIDFGFKTPTQKPFTAEFISEGLTSSFFCISSASNLLALIAE